MIINKKITDTQYAKTVDMKTQISQVVKYLINNRSTLVPYQSLTSVYQYKPPVVTYMTTLFEQMVSTGYVDEFAPLYPVVSKTSNNTFDSLPDLLTLNNIVLDLKTAPGVDAINSYYEFKIKMLINLAGLLKITDRTTVISDANELHSMYIRGLLTRSYSVSDFWLNAPLCAYIIKCYCMVISGIIARNENLDWSEQLTIAGILALYYAQKLSRSGENPTKPSLFFKCTFLGNYSQLNSIADRCAPLSQDGLTIPGVCELISELGPARLSRFNAGIFYRSCTFLGGTSNVDTTQIALEHPPYWTYMIINVLSGSKFGSLSNLMKQYKLDMEGKRFIAELKVSHLLFDNK